MATSVDAWIEQGSARQQAQLTRLRSILRATVPDAVESLKWGQPCYVRRSLFCYLQCARTHVTLGFQQGAVMNDPHGVLRGAGKLMRHVTFEEGDGLDAAVCADLIREAIRVDGDRLAGEAPRAPRYRAAMRAHLPEGFVFRERKSGEIEVLHVGKLAALLRGRQSEWFRERAAGATELELQHLMARVTGNYKRGNERTAARSGPDG